MVYTTNDFENIFSKLDSQNSEMCILGVHEPISANPLKLNCILDIYIIDQLINKPTRITNYSQTLIDLCLIKAWWKTRVRVAGTGYRVPGHVNARFKIC